MSLDALLKGLAAEGQDPVEGEFTLDREQARLKMRQFQLPNPLHYLLQLVEAAVCQGATEIDVEIDTNDVRLTFDGAPFTVADFEGLYGALFARTVDRGLGHLALGVNAAMALNPSGIRVKSGEAYLELRPGEADTFGLAKKTHEGTEILVRARFQLGLLLEFFKRLTGTKEEVLILEAACRYALIPITVNGSLISHGFELLSQGERWFSGDRTGIVGFNPTHEPARLHLIANGILVTSITLSTARSRMQGMTAIVDCSDLPRDVSQTDFVRGEAFQAMLADVDSEADLLLAHLCKPAHLSIAGARIRAIMAPLGLATEWTEEVGASLAAALKTVPIYDTISGEVAAYDQVAALYVGQPIPVSHFAANLGYRSSLFPMVLADSPLLEQHFGQRLTDVSNTIVRERGRAQNRARWQARAVEPILRMTVLAKVPLVGDGLRGEIGVRNGEKSSIQLIVQGGLIGCLEISLPLPGLEIIVEAPLNPNAMFDGVELDSAFGRVADAIVGSYPRLIGALAEAHLTVYGQARDCVLRYLGGLLSDTLRSKTIAAMRLEEVAAFPPPDYADIAITGDVYEGLGIGRGSPLAVLPILSTAQTSVFVSLSIISSWLEKDKRIQVVGAEQPPCRAASRVLRISRKERRILRCVFGRKVLFDYTKPYEQMVAEAAFQARPEEDPTVEQAGQRARFDVLGLTGEVCLSAEDRWEIRSVRARLYRQRRELGPRTLPFPLRELRAAVNCDALEPGPDWRGSPRDPALPMIAVGIGYGVVGLLATIEHAENPAARRLFLDVLNLPFPTYPMRRTYDVLRSRRAPDEADIAYRDILALYATFGAEKVDRALEKILAKDTTPSRKLVERRVDGKAESGALDVYWAILGGDPFVEDHAENIADRILRRCQPLSRIRALQTLNQPACLADVAANLCGGPVLTVRTEQARRSTDELVLVIDLSMRIALTRFFGPGSLRDAERFWRQQALRQAVNACPPLDSVHLDTLVDVPFRVGLLAGRVGLRKPHDGLNARSRLRVGRRGRLISTLSHRSKSPLDVMIEGATLPLSPPDGGKIHVRHDIVPQIREAAEAQRGQLLDALVDAFLGLPKGHECSVRRHVLDTLDEGANPALLRLPIFPVVGGEMVSIEVLQRHADDGTLCFADAHLEYDSVEGSFAVRVDGYDRRLLSDFLGKQREFSEAWDEAEAQRQFFEGPPRPVRIDARTVARISIEEGPIRGELGVLADRTTDDRVIELGLLKQQRDLGQLTRPFPLAGLSIVVDYDDLTPNATWTAAIDNAAIDQILLVAVRALPRLLEALADADTPSPTIGALVLSVVGLAMLSPYFYDAYAYFVESGDADAAYRPLAELGWAVGTEDVSTAIELLLAANEAPTAEAIREVAGPLDERAVDTTFGRVAMAPFFAIQSSQIIERIFAAYPAVHRLHLDPNGLTLATISRTIHRDGFILSGEGHAGDLAVLHPLLAHGIRCLFGRRTVRSLEDWRAEQEVRAALLEQPVQDPQIPADEVLVTIEVQTDLVRGVLGLEKPYPSWAGRSLDVGVEGRFVQQVRCRTVLPIVGVLDGDGLGLVRTSLGLRLDGLDALKPVCSRAQTQLLRAMLTAWPTFDALERQTGWLHARRWLCAVAEGRVIRTGGADLLEGLRQLPGFETIDGRRVSVAELDHSRRQFGAVDYMGIDVHGEPDTPERLVVRAHDPNTLLALKGLFKSVQDWSVAWRANRRRTHREALPTVPNGVLAQASTTSDSGRFTVWIQTEGTPTIAIGCEGVRLSTVPAELLVDLPCWGRIDLEVMGAGDPVERIEPGEFEAATINVYRTLVQRFAWGDLTDPAANAAARTRLRTLLNRFHAERDTLSADREALYVELQALPLLNTEDGREVDAFTAQRQSIHGLEVWFQIDSSSVTTPTKTDDLIKALRRMLRVVRDAESTILQPVDIDRVDVFEGPSTAAVYSDASGGFRLNRGHPMVAAAEEGRGQDPELLAFLASAIFTAANRRLIQIDDAGEQRLQRAIWAYLKRG